ncbi:glycosyl hydrolase [Histomonas meleagridis]|uniref:glycosyl hydrolase n=1 Tax=Histomonas meleagridis TaxID=135588 RepID=UPI00355AB926|nr:glycosyl hydrolase [Histomonas meleagridis]
MFILFLQAIICVEETEYKQCEQVGYCYRNREVTKQYWKLLRNSFEFHSDYFQALILDEKHDKQLVLFIYFLQSGIRFRIEPTESESFKRYDTAKDNTIINSTELLLTCQINHGQNQTHIFLRCFDTTVTISINPFFATISDRLGKIVTINSDDTAIFEFNRDRTKYPHLFDSNDFNGIIDKIPNGPTSVALDFLWHGDNVRLHGLPEHTLNLTLPFTTIRHRKNEGIEYQPITDPIRLFNVDIHRYEIGNPMSMYGSIPFLLSRTTRRSSGIFWSNPTETWVDINEERGGLNTRFLSEGSFIDFYIFEGPSPKEVINEYLHITGFPQLPQTFSFGFHMSRWGYESSTEVRQVIQSLDEALIPHESIFLDIDHTDDKMYFTFHPQNFYDVEALQDEIDPLERKLVAIIDPHLKVDYNYPIFDQAYKHKYLVTTRLSNEYVSNCWPGESVWIDFLNPWACEWWETLYDFKNYKGSTLTLYIWNDMNEPSVFGVPDHTFPRDLIHYGNIENREVHNIYGQKMIASTYNGLMKRDDDMDDRPFILTRSFFAGSQKYAFTWTGDNSATWEHLRVSLPMILSLGVSGMPFVGADVGGFFDSPSLELLVRWFQLAAWCYPFFRCHSHHKSERREPYLLKGGYSEAVKLAIRERYMLSPYWYTLARIANVSGEPLVRPIWWEFPNETKFADVEDCVMVGRSILVLPVLEEKQTQKKVWLPLQRWFDFRTLREKTNKKTAESFETPLSVTPVLIRGGSILPVKTWMRRTTYLMLNDPFTLIVALDDQGNAKGELYLDDGMTFQFLKNDFIHRIFTYENGVLKNTKHNETEIEKGEFVNKYRAKIERIKVVGFERKPISVKDENGNKFEIEYIDEVLVIHRVNLPIKENWKITFDFIDNEL